MTKVIWRKRRSVLTTRATWCDTSRMRSDQNGVGCQDSWRGINGASVELRTTQAVRFGSVWLCSAQLRLQCKWRLRRLANPCTTCHVFNVYLAENATRWEWSAESNAQSSRQERIWRDASRATRGDQNGVGYQDSYRDTNRASIKLRWSDSVRFWSARLGLQCELRLRHLANPCTTHHVFTAYLTENATRRK